MTAELRQDVHRLTADDRARVLPRIAKLIERQSTYLELDTPDAVRAVLRATPAAARRTV